MKNQLEFGIQTNGIKHTHLDPMPEIDERFNMVKDAKDDTRTLSIKAAF